MSLNGHAPYALALIALCSTACLEAESSLAPLPLLREAEPPNLSLLDDACPDDRQIARSTDPNGCPAVAGWSGTSVFEDGSPWLMSHGGTQQDSGGHWCRYEWIGAEGDLKGIGLPALSGAVESGDLSEFGSDCEVVHPQYYSAMADVMAPVMRDVFRDQIGWVSVDDLDLQGGGSGTDFRSEVVVAVIDTMPFDEPADPRSEHGESMARIVDDLACPEGTSSCDVTTARVLGLPRYAQGVDFVHGGYVGSQGELAAAIMEAVGRWQESPNDPKLIINLSVGWVTEYFGGDGTTSSTPANAVRAALEAAKCHGALIIAAAGNDDGLCGSTPLAPGAWEALPAPDAARCQELGITSNLGGSGYRPLVHAVGGLDLDDGPMPGTRDQARPRLQATATHAVAGETVLTTGLTGTSVAAAAVTGAAALLWSFTPSSTADEVMETLYAGGESLGQDATFQRGTAAQPMRKLHVCAALELACAQDPTCPGFELDCLGLPPAVELSPMAAIVGSQPVISIETPTFGVVEDCDQVCGADVEATGVGAGACTTSDPLPTQRYVSPQPNSPACPNCTLQGNQVHASLDSVHDGRGVDRVVVTLFDGDHQTRFDFGAVALEVDSITRLDLDISQIPPTVTSAEIAVTFSDATWPTSNQLIRL